MTVEVISKLDELAKLAGDPCEIQGLFADAIDYKEHLARRVSIDKEHLDGLVLLLRSVPWLAKFDRGIARVTPGGAGTVSIELFAHWLLAQTRMHSAKEALESLFDILERNSSELFDIVPIWGFSPKDHFELGNGLKIVPIELMPSSILRDYFLRVSRHKFSNEFSHLLPSPGSALVKTSIDGPIYEPGSSRAAKEKWVEVDSMVRAYMAQGDEQKKLFRALGEKMGSKRLNAPVSVRDEAEDWLAVMALRCPNPIFALGQWYQRPSHLPVVGGLGGFGWPKNEHPFSYPIKKQDYDFAEIASLVDKYQKLAIDAKKRMRTPLARLNNARMQLDHRSLDAAAMDLGMAAEALLTYDRDNDAPLSYLLRVRGTLLIGGSADERRRNYRILRDIYNLRSKVAHEGALAAPLTIQSSAPERRRHDELKSLLREGVSLCQSMLLRIIERGGFPKWDDLLLGIEP